MAKDKIKVISRESANKILDSTGEKYTPLGRYLVPDEVNREIIWTAIDNSTGEAWTEEFTSRMSASRWLNGHTAVDRFGKKHEGAKRHGKE